MILSIAGVEFEDIRFEREELDKFKDSKNRLLCGSMEGDVCSCDIGYRYFP